MPKVDFIEITPRENLSRYVEAFWFCRITEKGAIRLLPTACSELLIHRSKTRTTKAALIGPMTISQIAHVAPGDLFVGARLRPGCRTTIQEQDFTTLRDSKVGGSDISNTLFRNFEHVIQDIDEPHEIIRYTRVLIEAYSVAGLISRDVLVDKIIAKAELSYGVIQAKELLANYSLSSRQIRRRFIQYTSFTPKEFLRICRQQHASVELKRKTKTVTAVAANSGYADHAHLSHEFRAMVGVSPIAFEKELTLK